VPLGLPAGPNQAPLLLSRPPSAAASSSSVSRWHFLLSATSQIKIGITGFLSILTSSSRLFLTSCKPNHTESCHWWSCPARLTAGDAACFLVMVLYYSGAAEKGRERIVQWRRHLANVSGNLKEAGCLIYITYCFNGICKANNLSIFLYLPTPKPFSLKQDEPRERKTEVKKEGGGGGGVATKKPGTQKKVENGE
jgi:hypothetical protein